jgi:hypothetical protein
MMSASKEISAAASSISRFISKLDRLWTKRGEPPRLEKAVGFLCSPPMLEQSRKLAWVSDGLMLLGVAVLLRGPTIGISEIDWDESNFAIVAREILAGHWPYTTVFEHKPIALYLHFAAALALLGDSPVAVRMIGIATAAASAFVVRCIATNQLGLSCRWGRLLAICYLFGTVGFNGQAVYSEHLVNLYLLVAALLLPRRTWISVLLSGCASGIAININYLAIPLVGGMLAGHFAGTFFDDRSRLRQIIRLSWAFVAGAVATTVLVLVPVAFLSGLGQYFEPQIRFLLRYAASTPLSVRLVAAATLGAPLLPIVAAALALTFAYRRRADGTYFQLLFTGLLAGAAISVFASGYLFDHYMLLAVPWTILLLASLTARRREDAQSLSAGLLAGTSLMIALPGMIVAGMGAHNLLSEVMTGTPRDEPRRLAQFIRPMAPPGSRIYVVCAPIVIYQLLHARPANRYPFYPYDMRPKYAAALGINLDEDIAAVLASRPTLVVLGDYEKCGDIPAESWRKLSDALLRVQYAAISRYQGYNFLVPPANARAPSQLATRAEGHR